MCWYAHPFVTGLLNPTHYKFYIRFHKHVVERQWENLRHNIVERVFNRESAKNY